VEYVDAVLVNFVIHDFRQNSQTAKGNAEQFMRVASKEKLAEKGVPQKSKF
jgi:hypothetical protein